MDEETQQRYDLGLLAQRQNGKSGTECLYDVLEPVSNKWIGWFYKGGFSFNAPIMCLDIFVLFIDGASK